MGELVLFVRCAVLCCAVLYMGGDVLNLLAYLLTLSFVYITHSRS